MPEPESHFFWQAFFHLRGSRLSAVGLGAIPFTAIIDYAERFCAISCPVQKSRLVRMITALDNTERDYAAKVKA